MMKPAYYNTNESLRAIVAGLQISPEDAVIAVGGSGDQAFAMLESAGKVKVFDSNPAQLDYIRERVEALERGDYERFSGSDRVNSDNSPNYPGASFLQKSKQYLLGRNGPIEKIRQKLSNLEIAEPGNIIEQAQQEESYSRAYLSNIIGWCLREIDISEIMGHLENVACKLTEGGLIYVANHQVLVQLSEEPRRFHKNDLRITHFLPAGLKLDLEQSLVARTQERRWSPAIYKKVKMKS